MSLFARGTNASAKSDPRIAAWHYSPAINDATLEALQATLLSEVRTAHTFVAVADYFSRLDTAGDTTYLSYKQPLTNYISSLVTLGGAYWDDMVSAASFVGVGIQGVGIQGITVPLRSGMTAPSQNNFVAGDLDQLTGLKGDGSTKYLSTGILGTDLLQNDASISGYQTVAPTSSGIIVANLGAPGGGLLQNDFNAGRYIIGLNGGSNAARTGFAASVGLCCVERASSSQFRLWAGGAYDTKNVTSVAPLSDEYGVFAFASGSTHYNGRLATYHIGSKLDSATLEALQDTLITEIAAI